MKIVPIQLFNPFLHWEQLVSQTTSLNSCLLSEPWSLFDNITSDVSYKDSDKFQCQCTIITLQKRLHVIIGLATCQY